MQSLLLVSKKSNSTICCVLLVLMGKINSFLLLSKNMAGRFKNGIDFLWKNLYD
jgi:hypothetical protein